MLEKLRHEEPLNPREKDIHQQGLVAILRELHDDLDRAVFNAYGWGDLAAQLVGKPGATTPLPDKPEAQAQAEEELLSRPVDLNAQRAAEEAQGHIRWLRPEFQSPEAQTIVAVSQQEEEGEEAAEPVAVTPAAKLAWPKVLQEQIKVVRELLVAAPLSAEALAGQFKGKAKGLQEVLDALQALGVVACEAGAYRLM